MSNSRIVNSRTKKKKKAPEGKPLSQVEYLFLFRQTITGNLESVMEDLEVRKGAVSGQPLAKEYFKDETPLARKELLENQLDILNKTHQFINAQFDMLNNQAKEKEKVMKILKGEGWS